MKKGFTLVELLGVFSIISLILILSIPAVTNLLVKSQENQYYSFEQNIFISAEAYFSSNKNLYPELRITNKKTYVTIERLLITEFLNSNMLNPVTNKKVSEQSNNVVIAFKGENKLYTYELVQNVKTEEWSAIVAYEALTTSSTAAQINAVKTQVNSLPNGLIKEALKNKLGD